MDMDVVSYLYTLKFAVAYLRVVVASSFFYSSVLTFGDEVTYIWLRPFNLGTGFYLIGRYFAFVSIIYASYKYEFNDFHTTFPCLQDCDEGYAFLDSVGREWTTPYSVLHYTGAIVAASAMILLQLRTYVLYNKQRIVMGLFCILDVLAIVGFVLQLTLFQSSNFVLLGSFELKGNHSYSPIFWAPFLLNEVVTFLLVFFKFMRSKIKSRNVIMEARTMNLRSSLMRDNMIYFSLIFVVYAIGFFAFLNFVFMIEFAAVHMIASIAISGIIAPRLFVMLRKGYYNQSRDINLATDISTFHATYHGTTDTQISND